MSIRFDPFENLIHIRAKVFGPIGSTSLLLALDTGASSSTISRERLLSLGYELSDSSEGSRIVTGSRVEFAPQITVAKFSTLGQQRENFSVLAYDLPLEAGVDGVLGLDFFRGQNLNIDFRNGFITLS